MAIDFSLRLTNQNLILIAFYLKWWPKTKEDESVEISIKYLNKHNSIL